MSKITDPIADYLTRLRNALKARHRVVEMPASNMKKAITKLLHENGFILHYKFEDTDNGQGKIKIALKYNKETNEPTILSLQKISKPGLRKYTGVNDIPRVLNGLGIAVLSTSKGIITDKKARELNIGGEVLCYVY